MATSSTRGLLRAIEGFSGAHAGNPAHESTIELLSRVKGEIAKGKGPAPDSPGRREALNASQRNHPSEQAHPGSAGNEKSVRPAPPLPPHDPTPNPNPPEGDKDERMTAVASVPTHGHEKSNHPSGFPGESTQRFALRTAAGEKARFSRDTHSNWPGPAARSGEKRVGNVTASRHMNEALKAPREVGGAEKHGMGEPPLKTRNEPPVGGDRFARAAQEAKKRLRG